MSLEWVKFANERKGAEWWSDYRNLNTRLLRCATLSGRPCALDQAKGARPPSLKLHASYDGYLFFAHQNLEFRDNGCFKNAGGTDDFHSELRCDSFLIE